jgi:hypothetical protein
LNIAVKLSVELKGPAARLLADIGVVVVMAKKTKRNASH